MRYFEYNLPKFEFMVGMLQWKIDTSVFSSALIIFKTISIKIGQLVLNKNGVRTRLARLQRLWTREPQTSIEIKERSQTNQNSSTLTERRTREVRHSFTTYGQTKAGGKLICLCVNSRKRKLNGRSGFGLSEFTGKTLPVWKDQLPHISAEVVLMW